MLTGHTKIGDNEDAFKLGGDTYMFKPFSLQRLGEKSSLLMKSIYKGMSHEKKYFFPAFITFL